MSLPNDALTLLCQIGLLGRPPERTYLLNHPICHSPGHRQYIEQYSPPLISLPHSLIAYPAQQSESVSNLKQG
ncbi:MAG: hypothetical protein HRU48_17845 [Vibrio sp.]|uniref:hypothetical protein n=1 Tax=Vibrio TaxID=662 RepID=UPI001EB97C38|nr:hypothetical protein [Vibrio sp.]NRB69202.1 hypothetical protein [Vibrio sp.]